MYAYGLPLKFIVAFIELHLSFYLNIVSILNKFYFILFVLNFYVNAISWSEVELPEKWENLIISLRINFGNSYLCYKNHARNSYLLILYEFIQVMVLIIINEWWNQNITVQDQSLQFVKFLCVALTITCLQLLWYILPASKCISSFRAFQKQLLL